MTSGPEALPVTPVQRLVGAALVLPALVATVLTMIIPGVRILVLSVTGAGVGSSRPSGSPYGAMLRAGFPQSALTSLVAVVLPVLIIVGLGLLLGRWLAAATGGLRTVALVLLAVIIAASAPAVTAVALRSHLYGRESLLGGIFPALPPTVQQLLVTAYAITGTGLVLAVLIFAAAFRSRQTGPVLLAVVLVGAGTVALGLQVFTVPALNLSQGGPLTLWLYRRGFLYLDVGSAVAASVLIFAVLAVIGIAATVAVVASGARLELVDPPGGWSGRSGPTPLPRPAAVGPVLLVVVLLVMIAAGAVARATGLTGEGSSRSVAAAVATLGPTLVPSLLGSVITVGLAALAAVGIGYLRPLGSASPVLLLIFSPWLLVTTVPYLATLLTRRRGTAGSWSSLLQPFGVDPVALLLLTLAIFGLAQQWRATGDRARVAAMVVRPALGLGLTLLLLRWLWSANDLLWPLVSTVDPTLRTGPLLLYIELAQGFGPGPATVLLAAPLLVPAAVVLAVLLPRVAGRLRLVTGREG